VPNYIDRDLGGIANSGTYPNSRPQINVADTINAVAGAFNQNKQGVLQRAMMQAQNARANQQSQIEQEHAQAELRAQGFRPPEEMAGMAPGASQPPPTATPGPIAAAVQGPPPPVAGGAPVSGVSGMASPGRILPITGQGQTPPSTQMAPASVVPGTPPMQIQSGALPATAAPPMSAGDGSVTGGPSSLPAPSMAPAHRPLVTLGGNGPHGNWVRDLSQPLPQEQREIYIRQQALSAANDAYTREHPGAPPLFTPAEIAFGSQSDRVYNTMANRAETYQQQKIEKQQRYNDLAGATDAMGNPLSDVQRRAISNDPISYRNFVGNPAAPPKEAKFDVPSRIIALQQKGMSLEAASKQARLEAGEETQQPKQDHYTFVQGNDAKGNPVIYRGDTSSGELAPTGVNAKSAQGAQQQKARTYVDLMQGAFPVMEKNAGQIRPDVVGAAMLHPNAANVVLNQAEQDYVGAARSFLAGVLHQESGARLSHEQLNFGMLRYLPNVGDTPQTIQNKLAAAKQVIQERADELQVNGMTGNGGSGTSGGAFDDLIPKKK
jgi:hypothetical protein